MVMARKKKGTKQTISKTTTLIELKNCILQTLHKLSDRDTQQLAVEELEQIAQNLTPKEIALFLACLHDTDAQHKSVVRHDCIRLVGTLATIHGDLLACHLPKMIGNIIRRLKDPDSNIREACVETIGILALQIRGVDHESTTNVFVKPLLEALAEKHEILQTGASMCLAEVIKCMKDPHLLTLQRLCPRVVKMLASPNLLAKASLLNTIGVMVQVPGMVSLSQLSVLLGFAQEELNNSEWLVRKAIADILVCIATTTSTTLGSYRESILIALENARFDKVKPVRDTICEALQLWKSIYHTNGLHGAQPSKSYKLRSSTKFFDGDATLPLNDLKNSLLMRFGISMNSSFCNTSERLNKHANTVKKKTLVLSDRKTNLEFFRKVEGMRDFIDWQVGNVAPHDSLHEGNPRDCGFASENLDFHKNCIASLLRSNPLPNDSCETLCPKGHKGVDLQCDQNKIGQLNQPTENEEIANFVRLDANNGYQDVKTNDPLEHNEKWEDPKTQWDANDTLMNDVDKAQWSTNDTSINDVDKAPNDTSMNDIDKVQWNANNTSMNDIDKATIDMISVHQHFHSLERQQLSIMEMLQESMVHMQESLQGLEERVSRLEHTMGDTAQGSSNADGRSTIDESQSLHRCHAHQNYFSNDFFDGRESEEIAIPSSPRTQNSLDSTCGDSDEFMFIRTGHAAESVKPPSTVDLASSSLQKITGEETVLPDEILAEQEQEQAAEQANCTRACDRYRQGQAGGQVGRSVWHASRDEAIAAIRGAAIPAASRHGNHHHRKQQQQHSTSPSRDRDFNPDQKPHRHRVAPPPCGPFWMLWSRAMENVQSRNLDVAYSDILGSKDELLLVRLMGCTGPVWEQLGAATVAQLLVSIKQFLQQQSFLDCILPWLQQVSDLVSSQGPKALGLTTGETKDLVLALQHAASMDYAQSTMGARITELAEQLRKAWLTSDGKSS